MSGNYIVAAGWLVVSVYLLLRPGHLATVGGGCALAVALLLAMGVVP